MLHNITCFPAGFLMRYAVNDGNDDDHDENGGGGDDDDEDGDHDFKRPACK